MLNNSGIGEYIKMLIPELNNIFNFYYIGNKEVIQTLFPFVNEKKIISCNTSIYTISEQLILPFLIPKCDIYWSPHYNIPLLPIKAKKRITTIHDIYHIEYSNKLSILKRIYSKFLISKALHKSDEIITVSNIIKLSILKHYNIDEKKITVIHNAFNKNRFAKCENLILPNSKPYVLFVGNIKPHKNLMVLIKAYNLLENNIKSNLNIYLVGKIDGMITKDNELKKIIDCPPPFFFHFKNINNEELAFLYKNAECFIFPSLYEGFGLPLLEAMYFKIPIIASNISVIKEILENSALYFNPNNSKELSALISEITQNNELKKSLIKRGSIQLKKFSIHFMVDKHLYIINKI